MPNPNDVMPFIFCFCAALLAGLSLKPKKGVTAAMLKCHSLSCPEQAQTGISAALSGRSVWLLRIAFGY